ncbi:integrase [Sphingomonas sp. UYEF23]
MPTVAELAKRYLDYARTYKRSHDIDERYLRLHLLPRFGKLHLDQLDQTEIMEWLASKVAEGYAQATVNRWQVILSHMMRMAKKWGLPGSERNPLEGVKQRECNNAKERFLSPAETKRLQAAVENSSNTQLKHIVALLLLTGCRKRELLDARWEQVDLARKVWRIPTSKSGKARHVPLSDDAINVFASLRHFKDCPWVLPNPATLEPYTSVFNAWDTARREAHLPDIRMHDLRHSAASNMVNAGQSLYVVGKVLGHAQAKTTERYAHLSNETLLNAVNAASLVTGTTWAQPIEVAAA